MEAGSCPFQRSHFHFYRSFLAGPPNSMPPLRVCLPRSRRHQGCSACRGLAHFVPRCAGAHARGGVAWPSSHRNEHDQRIGIFQSLYVRCSLPGTPLPPEHRSWSLRVASCSSYSIGPPFRAPASPLCCSPTPQQTETGPRGLGDSGSVARAAVHVCACACHPVQLPCYGSPSGAPPFACAPPGEKVRAWWCVAAGEAV